MNWRVVIATVVAHVVGLVVAGAVLLVGLEVAFRLGGGAPIGVALWFLLLCALVAIALADRGGQ